jgi:hypothetical protein
VVSARSRAGTTFAVVATLVEQCLDTPLPVDGLGADR